MSVISGLRMEAAFPASFPVCEHCPRSSCGFGGKTAFSHPQELLGQELSLGAALDRRLSCLKHLRLQPGVQTGLNPKHASRVLRGLAKQRQVGFGTFFLLLLLLFLSAARCYPRTSALPNPGLSVEQRGIQRGFSPAREPDPPPVAAPEPAERGITSPRAGTAGAGLLCPADTGGPWKGGQEPSLLSK